MPITTLLAVVVALCLQARTVFSVQLLPSSTQARNSWGMNDVKLECRDGGNTIQDAEFTRNQGTIMIGNVYSTEAQGSTLVFTADDTTEGRFTCKNSMNESGVIAIVAYPDAVYTQTEVTEVWGMDLDLPCRYAPGPLANDPENFYEHKWTSILNGQITPIPPNDILQDNDNTYTLTFIKFNPVLARSNYRCEIDFNQVASQPYNLRDSPSTDPYVAVMIAKISGDVTIEKAPHNAVVSAGEPATFSCTLNVTGNEMLQFQAFDTKINDSDSDCDIDTNTYTKTVCLWPSSGMNMTCDYSIPYQITCELTINDLTTANSTQVNCSSVSGEVDPSESAGLAVRVGKAPTPVISKGEDLNLEIKFTLPAIPFIPVKVMIIFEGNTDHPAVNRTIETEDKGIVLYIDQMDIPFGNFSVNIRIGFEGDDHFSESSDASNKILIKNPVVPTSSMSLSTPIIPPTTMGSSSNPTTVPVSPTPDSRTVYYVLGGFGALLLVIFIFVLILALLLYRKRDGHRAKVQLNGYGQDPQNRTPLMEIQSIEKMQRSYSGSRSHSPPDNISNTNTAHTVLPEMSPSHISNTSSGYSRTGHSSASDSFNRYLHVQRMPPRELPRYGYPAEEFEQSQYPPSSSLPVQPTTLNLMIGPADQVPGINVQAPTPVTPANTEPFIPTAANTPDVTEAPFDHHPHTERPGILHIPRQTSSPHHNQPTPGTSTPISSEVALNIALYLMHKDCKNKDTCPTCRMIDNQFTKLLNRFETKAINKMTSSSDAKSKLRHKHKQPRTPRAANSLRPPLARQRSMSTSNVNDDELTLSSTETEDDGVQTDMDKRRRTKESHTHPRNFAPLSIRDVPKDIVASDSELAPTPSGRIYSPRKAVSPMKAARQTRQLPPPTDSFSSNDDSQATDGSDTSSHQHNSHPDLNSQMPVPMTFLPNPAPKPHHNSLYNRHRSTVSTSGYSSQSDNDSTVFRPVHKSKRDRTYCSDESIDEYHSDGFSYGSHSDYPSHRSYQQQQRKISLDTVVSYSPPAHYPAHHIPGRSRQGSVDSGQSHLSVHSANAMMYNYHPQENRFGRPSSASPSHSHHKPGMSYTAKPHTRSMSPIVSLPTSQSQSTPL